MPKVCTPANIYGPFEHTLFLGCSIKGFNCTVGWNEQTTSISVDLIEDPCIPPDDDPKVYYPKPGVRKEWTKADPGFEEYQPTIGAPVYFRFGDFEFAGIVQSWMKKDDSNGLGQYNVNISDPRFILQNTQIILNENNGCVGDVFNAVNAFGFHEQYGFGCSDMNEVGIPWNNVKLAVSSLLSGLKDPCYGPHGALAFRAHNWLLATEDFGLIRDGTDTNDPSLVTNFGGNGWYTGYFVDLHEIPFAPSIYRLQNSDTNLLDLISQVCADAGCDYYIELFIVDSPGNIKKIIKVRTQQRKEQPTLGEVQAFIDSRVGVIAKNVGRELRNEPTQSLAYGANKQYFRQTTLFEPWWGFDTEGTPHDWDTIETDDLGTAYRINLDVRKLNTSLGTPIPTDFVYVLENELRAALSGFEGWKEYCLNYNHRGMTVIGSYLYNQLNLRPFFPDGDWNVAIEDQAKAALLINGIDNILSGIMYSEASENDAKAVHAFVSKFADEFYGRKVLVPVGEPAKSAGPVNYYFNQESQKYFYQAMPGSEAWIEDGDSWLGLTKPSVYLDHFTTEQNMVTGGVSFAATTLIQDDGNSVTDGSNIYTRASVDSDYIIKDANPKANTAALGEDILFAVMDISSPGFLKQQEIGYDDLIACTPIILKNLQADAPSITAIMDNLYMGGGAAMSMGFEKKRLYPTNFAVPLRSNYTKYGPFGYLGPPGPVNLKPDDSLNPWEYDGSANMTIVANSQSQDGLTFMQVGERGSVNWPGYPLHRIGSELRSGTTLYEDYIVSQFNWSTCSNNEGTAVPQFYYYIDIPSSTGAFGPNITSVNVNVNSNGVTTTYELSTFTPSFGRVSKLNAGRIKSAAKQRVMQSKMARQQQFMRMYTQMSRNRSRTNRG